jgi:hypothetical protein
MQRAFIFPDASPAFSEISPLIAALAKAIAFRTGSSLPLTAMRRSTAHLWGESLVVGELDLVADCSCTQFVFATVSFKTRLPVGRNL